MITQSIAAPNPDRIQSRYNAMLNALRRANYRITPQRMAVCHFLAETRTHPTPSEIYHAVKEQFPTMSRATVYNTVAVLKELGEIIELPAGGSAGVRYETDITPHVNLTCLRCGRIFDVPLERLDDILQAIAERTQFQVNSFHIEGYGVCPDCQEA
ncbi:MAG TPA: transcriptional repressor [Anaerolineae bacterium]|nr:transcriptional repressor [Caldilineae bacterium]HID35036.1 transcriptional repressor [Anaerolineae bacterium]HIQ11911.1 transcriptional repressor [Caldilineales bacterium]